jgi:phosphomannomutase
LPTVTDPSAARRDLSAVIKAYDVRGVVGEQIDAALVRDLGAATARLLRDEDPDTGVVVVGHDMRPSSPELVAAFADGVTAHGLDVVNIGLASTDMLYFASGALDVPGAMFTASHNPAQYNGIKLCRAGAAPIGADTGLGAIREAVEEGVPAPPAGTRRGSVEERGMLADYAAYLHGLVDLRDVRPLKVVVDAGNGMAGHTVPAVLADLPLHVVPMYFELDGTFPNHEANPLDPANLVDLQKRVVAEGADIGLAFDGDADRCFVVDERGEPVSPSAITALVAARELAKAPGATVIHNLITSRAVPEIVTEHGGKPVRTRVGHSFIKQVMAETGAVFGGEHSAHYYFARNYRADSGLIATMLVLEELSRAGQELSIVRKPFERYSQSGEINTTVADVDAVLAAVSAEMAGLPQDTLDGLTVDRGSWWFNLRPSNTEPLLRLNLEAATRDECDAHVAEILALVTSV